MKNPQEQLIAWLNDAYSMEKGLAKNLANHAKDAEDFPEVKARTEQHIAETERHAEQVARCLALLGEKPSALKDAVGNIMGTVQGAASGMFRDELVKNVLTDYAAEHFEIAAYTSLIAAAEALGHPEIAEICTGILEEEEAMAEFLLECIPEITRLSLQQAAVA